MTEQARRALARVDTSQCPLPVELRIYDPCDVDSGDLPSPDAPLEVVATFVVADTDAARTIAITLPGIPLPRSPSSEDVLEAARAAVRWAVLHETDEWLLVDGVRRWDPHPRVAGARSPVALMDSALDEQRRNR
jgi:hypothetical protein